ncbi:MAG: histidine--tRNA ligase [Dehalococcoidia bacterium]|nr:histidine--tRNA ligase [Dehalococcoidia bacterium]
MADLRAPRGMNDLLPEDAPLWRHVRDTAERVAALFDYRPLATPIVEDAAVFERSAGQESDIVAKEMYRFEDRGGGTLALRPEGTAAVCRAYLEHGMASRPQPVRLYYLGPMFRYDRPQAGRYRQLWQFGVECIGDPSPAADVEVIELQQTLYEQLGLAPLGLGRLGGLTLRINSIGTAETRHRYVELLREHFRPHLATLSADSQRRFEANPLRILDSKEDARHTAVLDAPSILDHLDAEDAAHFAQVRALLDALGIAYAVDPRIVRGLDYYARTVWEFEPPGAGGQSTVGAGGRYDGLMELLGGPHTPGTGFATGIERIVLNLRERGLERAPAAPDVVTVPLGEAGALAAARLARTLRSAGLVVRAGTPGRSLRAALRGADAVDARYAVIVGNEEAAAGTAVVKTLRAGGEQRTLPADEVAAAIRRGDW